MPSAKKQLIHWIQPPSLALNMAAKKNYRKFSGLLLQNNPQPVTLCLGSGKKGGQGLSGLDPALKEKIINLDILSAPNINVTADGHELPFKDGMFDGVIIQAVLEHVKYPAKIIREAQRILKPGGYLYVETPFMQGVHGATDFQRYTLEGLKLLCGEFNLIDAGICVGPASAFINSCHAYLSLLFSLDIKIFHKFWRVFWGWVLWPWKYLDLLLAGMDHAYFSAGAFYYLGKKT